MLEDTDTRVLLQKLEERNAPLSWFSTDWPLENHFYRPVSTLSFELDQRLHPGDPAAFGFTSALICAICVLALFWFLRELTDDAGVSTAAALLFTIWNLRVSPPFLYILYWLAWAVVLLGLLRHRLGLRCWLPGALALAYLPLELRGMQSQSGLAFSSGVLAWLPARTATVMTLFCLLSVAAYARYERLSASRTERAAEPLDPPATKSTRAATGVPAKGVIVWPLAAIAAAALALGSYEQAVMLPAVLVGVALVMRLQGFRVRWGWQAAFWTLLAGYLVLRREVLPGGTSGYQLQQFRDGWGVLLSIVGYAAPALTGIVGWVQYFQVNPAILLLPDPYIFPIELGGNIAAYWKSRRRLAFALAGWAMSLLAFLPMAWLKPFVHYHYWPMALRSVLAVTLAWSTYELVVTAVSPRARQAPARPSPAPGSLRRL